MAYKAKIAGCHPGAKHYAHGLCRSCYNDKFYRSWAGKNKRRLKRYHLKWRCENWYGLTVEEYDRKMMEAIECDACHKPFGLDSALQPVLDHDHKKKTPRGIIHRQCNSAIGALGDNPKSLQAITDYLKKYE